MSIEDRAVRALRALARGLSAGGSLQGAGRELRERIGAERVRMMDRVVSALASHPVRTTAQEPRHRPRAEAEHDSPEARGDQSGSMS